MARPRNFSREGVLEKALPVFWKHGFADASLQELEKATGVNKSGLYSEFSGKEELFLESLRFYLDRLPSLAFLMVEPLGWDNIEQFLKLGPRISANDPRAAHARRPSSVARFQSGLSRVEFAHAVVDPHQPVADRQRFA